MGISWSAYSGALVTVAVIGTPLFSAMWMASNFWIATGRDEYRQLVDQWAANVLMARRVQPRRLVGLLNFFQGVFKVDQTLSDVEVKVKDLYKRSRIAKPEEWSGRYAGIRALLPPGTQVGGADRARIIFEETVERYEQRFGSCDELTIEEIEWLATASERQGPTGREWLAAQPDKWSTFKSYVSFLPSYLDYTGRGTALGLLIGLAMDRIFETGASWATLMPMMLGVSGAFLHGMSMAKRAAVAEGPGKNPWVEAIKYGALWVFMLAMIAVVLAQSGIR